MQYLLFVEVLIAVQFLLGLHLFANLWFYIAPSHVTSTNQVKIG